MKRTRRLLCLLAVCLLITGTAAGCGERGLFVALRDERSLPRRPAWDDPLVLTEIATQILTCRIEACTEVIYAPQNGLSFFYTARIVDVHLDIDAVWKEGDVVTISSRSGMIPIHELLAHILYQDAAELGVDLSAAYSDRACLAASIDDMIPIEVGKTYLFYLDDGRDMPSDSLHVFGGSDLYEIDGQTVWQGSRRRRARESKDELTERIATQIAARSGIADQMGLVAYLSMLEKDG